MSKPSSRLSYERQNTARPSARLARPWAERFPGYHTSRFTTPAASYTATLHHVKPIVTSEPSFESDLRATLPEYGFQFSQDSTDKDQGDMHATGVGHAASVFRNAAGLAKDALHRFTPGALTFSASEPSRQRLYDALAGKVALVHPDYTGYKITRGDSTHYALVHKSHVPAYFTTAAKHGLTPEALNTVRPGSRARLARGVRMTVDKAGRPDTGRRTARLVLYDHSLNRAAMRALINTSKFGYHAMHGGGVNNSYGYPAETDSVLSAATVHPDGIRVSQWYGRLPANKVTVGGAAAAAAGDPAVGNLFHDGRTEATRQAARRTVRQLHSARVRSGTHTANIVIPRDVLKAFHDFRDSPGVFADYAEEHGLISTDHANVIRANPSDETMASVILQPETIEDAKPGRYIVPQVRKPRVQVTTDPNDFAHSPATKLERVKRLAAIPPAGSGSVVVRVPTPTPVASTRPAPRPQPTFILPG